MIKITLNNIIDLYIKIIKTKLNNVIPLNITRISINNTIQTWTNSNRIDLLACGNVSFYDDYND